MGSAYFYLEPLISLLSLLKPHYNNPVVLATEYDLVPNSVFPKQVNQISGLYKYAMSMVSDDASRICVAGDSAGANLVLSMLLSQAKEATPERSRPGFATLLSPWVTLLSELDRDTPSDFLNTDTLHLYAKQYAGSQKNLHSPLVSPGDCSDLAWLSEAMPLNGLYITFGSEEVLGPEIKQFVKSLRKAGVGVSVKEEPGAVHAWVIARLFLANTLEDRTWGMREVVKSIINNIAPI